MPTRPELEIQSGETLRADCGAEILVVQGCRERSGGVPACACSRPFVRHGLDPHASALAITAAQLVGAYAAHERVHATADDPDWAARLTETAEDVLRARVVFYGYLQGEGWVPPPHVRSTLERDSRLLELDDTGVRAPAGEPLPAQRSPAAGSRTPDDRGS